jgi:hypothetical protein
MHTFGDLRGIREIDEFNGARKNLLSGPDKKHNKKAHPNMNRDELIVNKRGYIFITP